MNVDGLLARVRQGGDVEDVRNDVDDTDLPALAAAYSQLDWRQRLALVELVQDTLSAITRPLMHDFLVHSPDVIETRDQANVGRAIALCHVDGGFGEFERYLRDPRLVDARRKE